MQMRRDVLMAFLASGALWVVALGLFLGNVVLAGIAAVYVVLGAWLFARDGAKRVRTAVLLWGAAVLIWIALLAPMATLLGAMMAGVLVGSGLFALWAVPPVLMLAHLGDQRPRLRIA